MSPIQTLYAQIPPTGGPMVAVIGLAKNVGKTVVVGTLLRACVEAGRTVAVMSIGRDGEPLDALDDRPKPRIEVPAGGFAIIARSALRTLTQVMVLETLPVQSAVGQLVLIRAEASVTVELIGPVLQPTSSYALPPFVAFTTGLS